MTKAQTSTFDHFSRLVDDLGGYDYFDENITNELLRAYLEKRPYDIETEWHNCLDRALSNCESPIEEFFLIALCSVARNHGLDLVFYFDGIRAGMIKTSAPDALHVFGQAPEGKFRIDFKIRYFAYNRGEMRPQKELIIECDGHDFHERTKEQAQKDKSRDRQLTKNGFKVLRFTGSEIWADPFKCAEETLEILLTKPKDSLE